MEKLSVPKLAALFLINIAAIAAVEYSYSDQNAWNNLEGSFCNGMRQSPINIVTEQTVSNSSLTSLLMNNWDSAINGTWSNNGHTLAFNPHSLPTQVTTTNFIGQYQLLQFHFHWGPNSAVGSENLVNGVAYSGELHVVHQLPGAGVNAGNVFAVIAVFLQSNDSMDISGIWQRLNVAPAYNSAVNVSNIVLSSFLPSNFNYYYFEGSLTTPLCNETVQWFVLTTPISVPAQFFQTLRSVQDSHNQSLLFNYRNIQALYGRNVYQYPSSAVGVVSTILPLMMTITVTLALIS